MPLLLTKDAFCKKSGRRSAQNRLRIDLAAGDTTVGSRPIPPGILAELHCIAVREGVPVASVALSGIEILLGEHRAREAHDDESADR